MGIIITLPERRPVASFGPDDRRALDRLVTRLRGAGAVGWETDGSRAYVVGAEDETLLIVSKGGGGIAVSSGCGHELLWRGDRLAGYT